MARRRSGEYSMRSASSAAAFWVAAVVLLLVVGTPLVLGNWRLLAFAVAPALLLAWLLWLLLYRPSLRYDAERVVVVNIGRTHVIPWARVRQVRQRFGIEFELDDGRRVNAVGAPPPHRAGNVGSILDRRSGSGYDLNRNADILDGYRVAAVPGDEATEHRWDLIPLAIGAVLVVAVIVEVAVGI